MVATETTTIDQIKELYSQVKAKSKFIEKLGTNNKIDRSPRTIRNHWFSEFWSVPEDKQEAVLKLLKEEIKNQ